MRTVKYKCDICGKESMNDREIMRVDISIAAGFDRKNILFDSCVDHFDVIIAATKRIMEAAKVECKLGELTATHGGPEDSRMAAE